DVSIFFPFSVTHFAKKRRIAPQPRAAGGPGQPQQPGIRGTTMATQSFFSWLKGTKKSRTINRRRGSTVQLALEALEDRSLPSTATTLDLGEQVRGVFNQNQAAAVNLAPKGKAVSGHVVRKQGQSRRKPVLRSVTVLDNQTLLLQFTKNLGKSADRASSYVIPGLTVLKAARVRDARTVKLTTSPQSDTAYTLTLNKLQAKDRTAVTVSAAAATFQGPDTTPPRMTGAHKVRQGVKADPQSVANQVGDQVKEWFEREIIHGGR